MPSAGALALNSQTQASAVSTPKPIGPHEWVMAKLKVDEMVTDKFQVFANPPRASIGRGKKYDAYLAMVSEPYWLSKIQKQIAKTKPACRWHRGSGIGISGRSTEFPIARSYNKPASTLSSHKISLREAFCSRGGGGCRLS